MIALWYNGKYYDSWFNTLNDTDFMEVSMINLGLEPALCEWVEYKENPNRHNPRIIDDANKTIDLVADEFVAEAIITDPATAFSVKEQYFGYSAFKMFVDILKKQNEILENNFLEKTDIPPTPTQYADTPVQNKMVMNSMQKLSIAGSLMEQGQRSKTYTGEKELPPKFDNLKSLAKHLLSKPTKWNGEFLSKLKFYGDMK